MHCDRRQFLLVLAAMPATRPTARTRLFILGTRGGPRVGLQGRRNSSVLLLINDIPYVIDCGYGTSHQLLAAGVPLEKLRYVFVTHHHSDHNLDYGPMIYNGWVNGSLTRVDTYGPRGLEAMTSAFLESMKIDIETRIEDEGRTDLRNRIFAHDIDRAGVVMRNDDVTVTASRVPHPMIKDSFAYRFDARDRSVVISGDTAYSTALADLAKGADVLVHEVMYLPGVESLLKRVPNATRLREHLLVAHTVPEDVGRVAAQAGVKTVVLYHFVPADDPTITDEQWSAGVRKHFKGRIVVARDLMEI